MSIRFVTGDILEANVQAIVIPVNCIGIMGAGLAAQSRETYTDNYEAYSSACSAGKVRLGRMYVFPTGRNVHYWNPKYIINFPTKDHWKLPSKIEYIQTGLDSLVTVIDVLDMESIAIPKLGCGCGGLSWSVVKKEITNRLRNCNTDISVFE